MVLPKINKPKDVFSVWKMVIEVIHGQPRILLPFAALAMFELIALYILASSPHLPVSIVMAPIIKRTKGEIFLHYPFIYELLPSIFYYAKLAVDVVIGALTTGMGVLLVFYARRKESIKMAEALRSIAKWYLSLFLLAVILFACVHFATQQPLLLLAKFFRPGRAKLLFLGPRLWFNVFLPVTNFLIAIVLQGLFIYAIPYIVLKGKKFLSALVLGLKLFCKMALKTLMVIALPMFLYIPVLMLRNNIAFLSNKFIPEVTVVILGIGILVGACADALITTATTLLFVGAADEK